MSLSIASGLVPSGGGTFYLLEDIYIKGGLQIRQNVAARDAAVTANFTNYKLGSLVLTTDEGKIWQATTYVYPNKDNPTAVPTIAWTELKLGGGSDSGSGDGSAGGKNNPILNVRQVALQQIHTLPVGGVQEFALQMGCSVIMLSLTVSRVVQVSAYGTPDKSEGNPYTFLATSDHLTDDGTMILGDGTKLRQRNFSILANMEKPVTDNIYFTVESVDQDNTPVTVTITYLPLEVLADTPVGNDDDGSLDQAAADEDAGKTPTDGTGTGTGTGTGSSGTGSGSSGS